MKTSSSVLIHTFAALRFTTGLVAWLAPDATARFLGLGADRQQPFTTQLFGSRELTLALAITDTTSPQLRTRALQLGLLVDTLDVVAAVRGIVAARCRLAARSSPGEERHYSPG
jgi:hypothetical protein